MSKPHPLPPPKQPTLAPFKAVPDNLADTLAQVALREVQQLTQADIANAGALDETEARILDKEKLSLDNQGLREQLARAQDLHKERKDYANRLFWLISIWLGAVIIFMAGSASCPRFIIKDNVMIAFITSTTVSVIGLFVVVAKWLFPSTSQEEKREGRKGNKGKS